MTGILICIISLKIHNGKDMTQLNGDANQQPKNELNEVKVQPVKGALLHELAEHRHDPEFIAESFCSGEYPYKTKISNKTYETQKKQMQVELLKVPRWVRETGQKVVIVFEGRDAAGKGGTIKRFMEHLNLRGCRVVALEKPSETEQGQW
jgi:polyphosphate kinase 2 (PPK2 family)